MRYPWQLSFSGPWGMYTYIQWVLFLLSLLGCEWWSDEKIVWWARFCVFQLGSSCGWVFFLFKSFLWACFFFFFFPSLLWFKGASCGCVFCCCGLRASCRGVVFLFFGCGLRASMMHKWNLADMGRRKWHGGIRRIPCFLLFWESCKLSTFRKVIIRRRKWWMEESEEFLVFVFFSSLMVLQFLHILGSFDGSSLLTSRGFFSVCILGCCGGF